MRIAFITNVPSPYRVDFFNELGKYCELTVFFEKKSSDELDESWNRTDFRYFKAVFLKSIKSDVDKALSFEICKYLKKNCFDKIVVGNGATPTGIIAILHMKAKKIPYWIEGDGGFAKSGKGIKEGFKRFLMKSAVGCFSTSVAHDEYYKAYGISEDKIYRYPFTSLFEKDIRQTPCDTAEKAVIRAALGITEERYVVTVGQYIYRKGFDVLLKAAAGLPRDVGIYFIGGTPTEEYIALKEKNDLKNIHFVPFTDKETLKKWYAASELMALPTREDIWGLVVNEAMAAGVPVVTTDRCIAGLEIVQDGINGYIVPAGEIEPLKEKIGSILNDAELHQTMVDKCLSRINEYTFESMAKRHLEAFGMSDSLKNEEK